MSSTTTVNNSKQQQAQPKPRTKRQSKNKQQKQQQPYRDLDILSVEQPYPDYSSFIRNNPAYVKQMNQRVKVLSASTQLVTTSPATAGRTQLSTEENTKNLKAVQNDQIREILGPDASDAFRPTHDYIDLIRFHECWREDGIAAAIVDLVIWFVLGEHFKTIIDVNEEFDATDEGKEQARQALERYNNDSRIKRYKKQIDTLNKKLRVHKHLQGHLAQRIVFGRACWLNELDPETSLPVAIKPLPSMSLGRLFHHRKTWDLLGIEYLDFKFPQSILKIEEVFYSATKQSWHMTPGSLDYGYSLFEKLAPISELNRIINQRNLKEINFRMWAQMFIIRTLVDAGFDKTQLNKLKEQIKTGAGNVMVTTQQYNIESHQLNHDGSAMIEQRDRNNKEMIRQGQAPEILFDPRTFNRATADKILQAWESSVLRAHVTDVKDTIQDQWINKTLTVLIDNEFPRTETVDETSLRLEEDQAEVENWALNVPRDEDGNVEVWRLPWKIKVEFERPSMESFAEKVEAAVKLIQASIIKRVKALKLLEFDDEIEQAKLEEQQEQQNAQNEIAMLRQELARLRNGEQTEDQTEEGQDQNQNQDQQRQRGQILNEERQERFLNAAIKAFDDIMAS